MSEEPATGSGPRTDTDAKNVPRYHNDIVLCGTRGYHHHQGSVTSVLEKPFRPYSMKVVFVEFFILVLVCHCLC